MEPRGRYGARRPIGGGRIGMVVVALALLAPASHAAETDFDVAFGDAGFLTLVDPVTSSPLSVGTLEPYDSATAALVGVGGTGNTGIVLLDEDGVVDETFGSGGVAVVAAPPSVATRFLILADGSFLVTGTSGGKLLTIRATSTGALDAGFGTGGVVETDLGVTSLVVAAAEQSDGKIVVLGSDPDTSLGRIFLVRYLADGSLDGSFGTGGIVDAIVVPAGVVVSDMVVQQDDRILVVADRWSNGRLLLARFDSDGSLDPTYGTGGVVEDTAVRSDSADVELQPDGRALVLARDFFSIFPDDAVVSRYDAAGALDSTFGIDGRVRSRLLQAESSLDRTISIRVLDDGTFLMVGVPSGFLKTASTSRGVAIERYDADGALDVGFGPCAAAFVFALPSAKTIVPSMDDRLLGAVGSRFFRIGTSNPSPVCAPAAPGKARVKYIPNSTFLTDTLIWKWKGAAAVQKSDFGDPVSDTAYVMCVLDEGGVTPGSVRAAGTVRDGPCTTRRGPAPCWKESTRGFQFADRAGAIKMKLLSGDAGKAKIILKDKTEQSVGEPPFGLPVQVRLLRVDGQGCWEASFSEARVNAGGGGFDAPRFVAKSD